MISFVIITVIILSISITFAWFTMMETTDPIIFNTGSLTADLSLYQGIDHNHDQEIDEYREVTKKIDFQNVIPGEVLYFRVIVQNEGTIDGSLDFFINEIDYNNDEFLEGFKMTFINPLTNNYQEMELSSYQNGLNIFHGYLLEKEKSFTFDFTINVKGKLQSLEEAYLEIKSFCIKLEQIH